MATANFNVTFWQPSQAVQQIANQTGSLVTNTAPPSSDQIGSFSVIAGTLSATSGNTSVANDSGPDFTANIQAGDCLVGYDGSNWILLGTVDTVSASSLALTEGSANTVSGVAYAVTRSYGRPNQKIYARVETLIGAGSNANARQVPFLRAFRTPNNGDSSVYCDTSIINLTQFSETNTPNADPASPETIQCLVRRTTTFAVGSVAGTAFANTNQFPLYMWYEIDPYGSQDTLLAENTRFNIEFQSTLEAYEITVNTPALYYSQVPSYGFF